MEKSLNKQQNIQFMLEFVQCYGHSLLSSDGKAAEDLLKIHNKYFENGTVKDVTKLLSNIRRAYLQVKRQIKKNPGYKPRLWYYSEMDAFMRIHEQKRNEYRSSRNSREDPLSRNYKSRLGKLTTKSSVSVNTYRTKNVMFMNDFIDCLIKNKCLWNKDRMNRENLERRQDAYGQLHDIYKRYYQSATLEDTKSLFYVVFSGYRKIKKRIASDPTYKPVLWYFSKLDSVLSQRNDFENRQNNTVFMTEFLQCYKNNDSLWNRSNNNRFERENALLELLKIYNKHYIGGTFQEVKNLLYVIRKCHRREYHKVMRSNGSHKPRLWYYDIVNSFYTFKPRNMSADENNDSDATMSVTSSETDSETETESAETSSLNQTMVASQENECSNQQQLPETIELSSSEEGTLSSHHEDDDCYLDDILLNVKHEPETDITIEPIAFSIHPITNAIKEQNPSKNENSEDASSSQDALEIYETNIEDDSLTNTMNSLSENIKQWEQELSRLPPKKLKSAVNAINQIIFSFK